VPVENDEQIPGRRVPVQAAGAQAVDRGERRRVDRVVPVRRDELGHVGVDHLCASAACDGGAVVTVDHEVRLAELDRDDRREGAVGERAFERAQPVAPEGVKRAEVAGERAGAAVCSNERVKRDLADAQVPAPERLQSPLDLVELEQPVAGAAPQSPHLQVQRNNRCASLSWPTRLEQLRAHRDPRSLGRREPVHRQKAPSDGRHAHRPGVSNLEVSRQRKDEP
jgi:hypothetical protein